MNESRACMRYVRMMILRSRATTACLLPEHSLEILPRRFTPTDPRRPSWPHSFEATGRVCGLMVYRWKTNTPGEAANTARG